MTVTIFRAREVLPAPDGPAMPTIMVLLFLLRSNCRQLASKVGKKKKKNHLDRFHCQEKALIK
jgi:hypothetical protein